MLAVNVTDKESACYYENICVLHLKLLTFKFGVIFLSCPCTGLYGFSMTDRFSPVIFLSFCMHDSEYIN
jgi:hypothetical protein